VIAVKKIIRVLIDNYGTAAFCSSSIFIFGDKEHLNEMAESLGQDNKNNGFYKAWTAYSNGAKQVTYNVAYNMERFGKDCTIIQDSLNKICNLSYEADNTWGFPYHFVADEFWFERILIKDGKDIHIAIRPAFKGLRITSRVKLPDLYIDHTWGYPAIYKYDDETKILESRVYILEKTFSNKEFEQAMDMFVNNKLELKQVFAEIVGDG
jgi:hypothetical protein